MTDQQLTEYSREHLMHELSMLWELADILPKRKASTETSALVESFGVHLRNLIDFFFRKGRGDDVTAQDFLDLKATWKPTEPPSLTKAHERANKELNHLTQARISGSPPEKAWDTAGALKEIQAVAKAFAAKASPNRLDVKVREFLQLPPEKGLIWIGGNVSHSNVAVQTASVTIVSPVPSNTTQTRIIDHVIVKRT
jgi:hypothetical protein